ncbi:LapA family protein [Ferrimonas balearica]|uniref:LapA family protein n=1 Tax=Ferrimonas balearica TaxID=44012 RepID=UPI001C5978A8|nr:LapA family protein [Ferrimonas balearica]MBY6016624.1 LapA family protein [Halomonas denitrificans]MBW3163360.1 LapA family protein [Ferrimonas balearica]MBY5981056.1 LapA family protein [Ferrimonas balearica]MBY6106110.1 LapA family protein [Ferrimonas balearica]
MKAFLITAVVAALFVLMMAFGAQNDQTVTVNYFIAKGEVSLPMLLAGTFLTGFIISWLLALGIILRQKLTIRKLRPKASKDDTTVTDAS